jgi:hypothetical protein
MNDATAVLQGLLYLSVKQQSSVVSHVQKEHDHAGNALLENANAWVALSEIFTCILRDPSLNRTYLIVVALDECVQICKNCWISSPRRHGCLRVLNGLSLAATGLISRSV